jgi:serine/threonine protein phosphatase 1
MSPFRQILGRFGPRAVTFDAPIDPQDAFVAIGDIHGRLDLLQALLDRLGDTVPDLPLVFLGDYVDRGPDSAGVLRLLHDLGPTCLMGNHESMLLEFLDSPETGWPRWRVNGGDATVASFGLDPHADDPAALSQGLRARMGDALCDWLAALPLTWQSGNVMASHAGGDPTRQIEPRRGHGLLWGHPKFLTTPRRDGLWMVHGHFIHEAPEICGGRIAVDTGAFVTGKLSAAIIRPGDVHFVTVD